MLSRARAILGLSALLAIGGVVLGVAPAAVADTSDFTFESLHADYALSRDADGTARLEVVETIVAVFPDFDQNRGIIRAIPDRYLLVQQETEVTSVTDANGVAVPFEEFNTGEFVELALGTDEFVRGRQTYVISYTQRHVVGAYADTASDEFYQDVNGTGWDQPFGRVSATVRVTPELTGALTGLTGCAYGAAGSDSACAITPGAEPDGGALFTASVDALRPRETLTVSIGFAPGTFVQGTPSDLVPTEPAPTTPVDPPTYGSAPFTEPPAWYWVLSIGQLLGVIGVVVAAITVRLRSSRKESGGIIIPQYSVPKNLNVMVAAHLAGRPRTAIPAQLISLAVRKNLRILDYPVTASGSEYTLQYLTTDGADPLELQLLGALFGPTPVAGAVRELAPNDAVLGSAITAVSAAAAGQLTTLGYRGSRSALGCLFPALAFMLVFGGFGVLVVGFAANTFTIVSVLGILAAFLGLFITLGAIRFAAPLTAVGQTQYDYLLGMRMYLELAEQERFRMLQSPDGAERVDVGSTTDIIKLYEKLLPFAVIWGVEDQWMHELEVRVQQAQVEPEWFASTRGFSSTRLTSTLRGISTRATYTPPAPKSRSSSSSSSGGRSWSSGSGRSRSSFSSRSGGSRGGSRAGGGGRGGGGGGR